MKKLIVLILSLSFLLIPQTSLAHYNVEDGPNTISLGMKAEVSKDGGTNWYSFTGDDAINSQTLSVSPGDTINFRFRIWNEGNTPAVGTSVSTNIVASEIIEITSSDIGNFLPSPDPDVTTLFLLAPLAPDGSATALYEEASFVATVKSSATNGTLARLIYTIDASLPIGPMGESARITPSFIQKAYADTDGTAVGEARVQVNIPQVATTTPAAETVLPQTGAQDKTPVLYLFLALILSSTIIYVTRKQKVL